MKKLIIGNRIKKILLLCFAVILTLATALSLLIIRYEEQMVTEKWLLVAHLALQNYKTESAVFGNGVFLTEIDKLPDVRMHHCPYNDGKWFKYLDDQHHFWGHTTGDGKVLVIDVLSLPGQEVNGQQASISRIVYLAVSIVVLLSLACLVLLVYTLSPINRLSKTLGNHDIKNIPDGFSKEYPNDEIGVLARIFERKVLKIKQLIEREQQFTRDVSHELRTSIAIIKNLVSDLQENYDLTPAVLSKVERIGNANFETENTIKTLLLLAREDYSPSEKQVLNVVAVIEECVIQHAHLLDGKSVDVEVDAPPTARVAIQSGAFSILISNLISNAFQYTHKGKVEILFKNNMFIVRDTGVGIPEDMRDSVSEPFIKGSRSKGFGVGLSIVKKLCETYHFRMRISFGEEGRGTTICVFFD